MGTRGSVGFIYEDKESLGYNQFDSYPEGLGEEVLYLISKINNDNGWGNFINNAKNLKDVGLKKITDQEILEKYEHYSDLSVSEQSLSDPYCLFRNIQGVHWLSEMYFGNLEHYTLNNNFIKDSLFCEYAYIINLDDMTFEFYNGFQKKPQPDNRFGTNQDEDGYYPCKLVYKIPLQNINSSNVKDIVEEMEGSK